MGLVPARHGGEQKSRHFGRGHISALDGLRGFAVLAVMATHLFTGDLTRMPTMLVFPLETGVSGVDVFFALSGFLITGILLDSLHDGNYFKKFYARRVLRIFPLYYGLILLLLLLTPLLHVAWNGVQWSLLLYLQNTHLLFPSLLQFDTPYFSVAHLWSLAVEEQFYLVWPLVVALVRSRRLLLALCGFGIVASYCLRVYAVHAGYGFEWVNRNMLCRSDQLLAGAALALLVRGRFASPMFRLAMPLLPVTAAVALAAHWGLWKVEHGYAPGYAASLISLRYSATLVFAAMLLLCAMQPSGWVRTVCEGRVIRWFGKYSYGLYVIHYVVLPGLTLLLLNRLRVLTGNKVAPRILVGLVAFVLSCVLAYASFHLYEKRFLRLKRFFDYAPERARVTQA